MAFTTINAWLQANGVSIDTLKVTFSYEIGDYIYVVARDGRFTYAGLADPAEVYANEFIVKVPDSNIPFINNDDVTKDNIISIVQRSLLAKDIEIIFDPGTIAGDIVGGQLCAVSGNVTIDTISGEPIEGLQVVATDVVTGVQYTDITDAAGAYTVNVPLFGTYSLRFYDLSGLHPQGYEYFDIYQGSGAAIVEVLDETTLVDKDLIVTLVPNGAGGIVPTITITQGGSPLSNINFGEVTPPATSKVSYVVSAVGLVDDLVINFSSMEPAQMGQPSYALCLTENGTYTDELTLTPDANGSIANTTIWVEFNPDSVAVFTATIAHTHPVANDKYVTLSGSGI